MGISAEDQEIKDKAYAYAKKIKKKKAEELTCKKIYPPEEQPMSVFMAGSPGAGKTEFAKSLLKPFKSKIIHIDVDEYRKFFAAYNGKNSDLFQGATSLIANKVHDLALINKQSFIFDTTMRDYEKAHKNITRSAGKGRTVRIYFIYKNPENAWHYVQKRETIDGRRVPPNVFAETFCQVQKTVDKIKKEFGDKVTILLISENHPERIVEAPLQDYIKDPYTEADIKKIITTKS